MALPLSVRAALALTSAVARGDDAEAALHAVSCGHDAFVVDAPLDDWVRAGESLFLAALPRPGSLAGMPVAASDAMSVAVAAGECVVAATVGGLLVPSVTAYGPPGDRGLMLTWSGYAAEPVAAHRLSMITVGDAERDLRGALQAAAAELDGGSWPLGRPAAADRGRAAPPLPPGIPARVVRLMHTAADTLELASAAISGDGQLHGALDAHTGARRAGALTQLARAAAEALTAAATIAAMSLAPEGFRAGPAE